MVHDFDRTLNLMTKLMGWTVEMQKGKTFKIMTVNNTILFQNRGFKAKHLMHKKLTHTDT